MTKDELFKHSQRVARDMMAAFDAYPLHGFTEEEQGEVLINALIHLLRMLRKNVEESRKRKKKTEA